MRQNPRQRRAAESGGERRRAAESGGEQETKVGSRKVDRKGGGRGKHWSHNRKWLLVTASDSGGV
jgi:hypothetical protein